MNILSCINPPDDVKALSIAEFKTIAAEIRNFLIENATKTGGLILMQKYLTAQCAAPLF